MINEHILTKQGNQRAAVGHVKPGFAALMQKKHNQTQRNNNDY